MDKMQSALDKLLVLLILRKFTFHPSTVNYLNYKLASAVPFFKYRMYKDPLVSNFFSVTFSLVDGVVVKLQNSKLVKLYR